VSCIGVQVWYVIYLVSVGLHLNEDNVGEFLIDMSRLFQSETIDGINELAVNRLTVVKLDDVKQLTMNIF
jgi:hypothetical protein